MTNPVDKAMKALEFYSHPLTYAFNDIDGEPSDISQDRGRIAREALLALKAKGGEDYVCPVCQGSGRAYSQSLGSGTCVRCNGTGKTTPTPADETPVKPHFVEPNKLASAPDDLAATPLDTNSSADNETPSVIRNARAIAEKITGACTCHAGYKDRKLIDPGCAWHEYADDIAQAIHATRAAALEEAVEAVKKSYSAEDRSDLYANIAQGQWTKSLHAVRTLAQGGDHE